MGISTYFGLDKDIWLNDMLNSLLWTGELVSEARSENGYGKGFLLGQDMENQGHIITPGGGDSHKKQTGMLVVSLRGVNFGFWSRLGCSGQSANILSRQGLV